MNEYFALGLIGLVLFASGVLAGMQIGRLFWEKRSAQ